ncbi:hypothetical protein [Nocardia caishijiensis]|uniref:Secreted protein n=1 Tax=Nocardia caishijiensis TaxID=184756 RepID=A0ABQ6YJM4_9NOCA|nr:hypothetical protein [Nocardia caishijiensis]KAF0846002.1 hypothetical protein FNL39_106397 [Nocardia caishijiensis]
MKQRFTVAALGGAFAALVAVAPPASAQQVVPGVDCHRFSCTNNTDDPYRVDALVLCTEGASVPRSVWVPPRGSADLPAWCPPVTKLGTPKPPRWELQSDGTYGYTYPGPPKPEVVQSFAMTATFLGAQIDHDRPSGLSSGS